MKEALFTIISKFDREDQGRFSELDIYSELRKLMPKDQNDIDFELLAEVMAFDFSEGNQDRDTGWGTYFGPMWVWPNANGTYTESPSIKKVTPEMIRYWEKRAGEASNPILKARYFGLVWDLSEKVMSESPSFDVVTAYIENLLKIAENNLHKYETYTIHKLKRALNLALSINSVEFIEKCKKVIVTYEDRIAQDNKPGLWGFSFDFLVENNKITLADDVKDKIINDLEGRLKRLVTSNDPWDAERAAVRLARYYMKAGKNGDVRRVMQSLEKAYAGPLSEAAALLAVSWLENLHSLFVQFNLKEDAENILTKLRRLGMKAQSELKEIPFTVEVTKKEMDEYLDEILKGNVNAILTRVAISYIPRENQAKEEILKLSEDAPIQFLITRKIQNGKGRTVASVKSLHDDPDGQFVQHIAQNLVFTSMFLRKVFEEAIKRFNLSTKELIEFIKESPIISSERLSIFKRGIEAYFAKDFVVSLHVLIPQIEEAIRNLVEISGGNVLKPSRLGGFHLRNLDDLLRDEIVVRVLGEDLSMYLRVLFVDQRGWNLRHNVCHGAMEPHFFNEQTADRVLHALLCLGLIRN